MTRWMITRILFAWWQALMWGDKAGRTRAAELINCHIEEFSAMAEKELAVINARIAARKAARK